MGESASRLIFVDYRMQVYNDATMKKPKYIRNAGTQWKPADKKLLRKLASGNTPTRVAGFKLGRTAEAVYAMAQILGVSMAPPNQSPYNRRKKRR